MTHAQMIAHLTKLFVLDWGQNRRFIASPTITHEPYTRPRLSSTDIRSGAPEPRTRWELVDRLDVDGECP
jgi:hypothetical protein